MITIRQGESYRIIFDLQQDGQTLAPDMIEDLKICIGSDYSKTYKKNGVFFDQGTNRWYIFPTQKETLEFDPGKKPIFCHIKYQDGTILIHELDTLNVTRSVCQEEF